MDPVTLSALITGGAALGSAGASYMGQRKANKANVNSAREQMRFQENMSSTAHQRQMQDMRLAGLNPMMSSKLGGASTPGGASSTSEDEFGPAVSSALNAVRQRAELAQLKNQIAQSKTAAEWAPTLAHAQHGNMVDQSNLLRMQTSNLTHSAIGAALQNEITRAVMPKLIADAKFGAGKGGEISRWLGVIGQGASTALDFKNLLTPKFDNGKYFWGSKATGEIFNH